jgi:hypothetical protein
MSGKTEVAKSLPICLNGANSIMTIKEQASLAGNQMPVLTKKKLFIVIYLLSFIIFVMPYLIFAYPPGWSDDILLTPETNGYRDEPDICIDSYNNVWVVWDSVTLGNGYIYYSKRDSLGNCIIPETVLPDPQSSCIGNARVVVDRGNNVHIEWTEPSPTGLGIGYAKLDSNGMIIVSPKIAMPGYGGGGNHRYDIALDKYGNINVAWVELPLEAWQISYTKLDSMGDTLISRVRVSPVGMNSIWPGIGVDSMANIHLGYRTDSAGVSDRLTYSKLDKNGNILISNKVLGIGMAPTIICDQSQNVHMVYIDPTGPGIGIKYLKLDQDGDFIVPPKTISVHENNNYVHMAMDSLQFLHVVWHLEVPMGVVYTKLETLGNYVIPPIAVVDTPQAIWPGCPRIAVDRSNRLHLVWDDQRLGSVDVYYKRGENEAGIEEYDGPEVIAPPKLSASPNPFFKETTIEYAIISSPQSPYISVYDISGRKVREFAIANKRGNIVWDGTNASGIPLPAGIYYIELSGIDNEISAKVILLR